jgi:hypothetical protein
VKQNPKRKKRLLIKLCKVCLKNLDRGCYGFHFCSKKHYNEHSYREYIKAWLKGNEPGGTIGRISRYVRRWIYEKRDRKCEKCGWSAVNPATNKCPVEINHIDGDSSNHRPENLELLCPNCHSLTPTHGALNNGNGRKKRKKDSG